MVEKEPKFTVLNPEGLPIERPRIPLTPRLDTLEGKRVRVVYWHGGPTMIMKSIADSLEAAVPGCEVEYYESDGFLFGPDLSEKDWRVMTDCDAAIVGLTF